MTYDLDLDLDRFKTNKHVKHPGQRSFTHSSKFTVRTHRHTKTYNWPTSVPAPLNKTFTQPFKSLSAMWTDGLLVGSWELSVSVVQTRMHVQAHWEGVRLELPGGGLNPPPVHVYRRSFLSENRFKISIPVENSKHFDIWPAPVLLGQFQHWRGCSQGRIKVLRAIDAAALGPFLR